MKPLTLHGAAGERRLRLPPGWRIEPAERIEAAMADGYWRIPYAGGDAARTRITRAPSQSSASVRGRGGR